MAYNTGNAIGSTSPKDLSDNARNLDLLVLGSDPSYLDRKGVPRKSWKGMENEHNADQIRRESEYAADKSARDTEFAGDQAERVVEFSAFLASSGYETPVDYAAGISMTRPTQVLKYLDELYRAKNASLPFTTTVWAADSTKLISMGDMALRQELSGKGGYTLICNPSNIAELKALPTPNLGPGRTIVVPVSGTLLPMDGGESDWHWKYNSNETHDGFMVVKPDALTDAQPGRWLRIYRNGLYPEFFGAKCDYDWHTSTGTVETVEAQRMLNFASKRGDLIRMRAGKKCLVGTLYAYYHATKNPGWQGNAGRIKIIGESNGHATGELEDPGCAFVHINGSANILFDVTGVFDIALPLGMGGYVSIEDFNLVGGNATTEVLRIQGSAGRILTKNLGIKVANPSGSGFVLPTAWAATTINTQIWGRANGDGSWTGTGLDIKSDGSGGQINMQSHFQMEVYKLGNCIKVGRGATPVGTFGPITFVEGQTAWADQYGMILGGGIQGLNTYGMQHEQSRLNGLLIDSQGANDIPRQIKIVGGYFTHCGKIQDGSTNEFAIHNVDGVGVEIDGVSLQNSRSGIIFDRSKCREMKIRRPDSRTVLPYGLAFGRGIDAYGTLTAGVNITLEEPRWTNGFLINVTANAAEVFARCEVGDQVSLSAGLVNPNISLGGTGGNKPAGIALFNNPSATVVTNIIGGQLYKQLVCHFSNTNTTIQRNSVMRLMGTDFTPVSSDSILILFWDGNSWNEISRSQN